MTQPSFDLTTEPWLPIIRHGSLQQVGLRELFSTAHDIADLAIPVPPAASGIWRILYAITARITGLDDTNLDFNTWSRRRNDLITSSSGFDPQVVDAYFDRWASRFDLFHPERPWLQDPRLKTQCKNDAGVNKLVFSRSNGNNQVWFDHHHDHKLDPLPPSEAAWHLVAQLYYGAPGGCSTREVDGLRKDDTQAGPLRGTLSFHPVGETLFQSLLAGLVHPGNLRTHRGGQEDLAPWEMDTLPDPLGSPPIPGGFVSALTNRARHAILLTPDQSGSHVLGARLTWAFRADASKVEDPYLIHHVAGPGDLHARPASNHRALWRDLDALVADGTDTRRARRPRVLLQSSSLPLAVLDALRVRAFGFDQGRGAKDYGWFVAITPPILKWAQERDPEMARGIARTRLAAEESQRQLSRTLREAWKDFTRQSDKSEGPWVSVATSRYWPRAERVFWQILNERRFDEAGMTFSRIASEVYDEITDTACRSPRGAHAVYTRRHLLFPSPSKSRARATTGGSK